MEERLPDIVLDGTTPTLFLTGFGVVLALLLCALGVAAWLRRRARMAGIHAKYVTLRERPARRRSAATEPGGRRAAGTPIRNKARI